MGDVVHACMRLTPQPPTQFPLRPNRNQQHAVREYKKEAEGMVLTPMEKEDEPRILAARQRARQHMLRGEYEAAVNVLVPWRPKCSVRTLLGCQTLMDLAVAYEAVYDFDKAQEIYRLVRSSPVKDLRAKAKALNLVRCRRGCGARACVCVHANAVIKASRHATRTNHEYTNHPHTCRAPRR